MDKEVVRIDYSAADIPESVRNFRPDVYRDKDKYCLILGKGEHAIISYADSVEEAMKRWDEAYWLKRYSDGNK